VLSVSGCGGRASRASARLMPGLPPYMVSIKRARLHAAGQGKKRSLLKLHLYVGGLIDKEGNQPLALSAALLAACC
jgi:hypothetical protein